MRKELKKRVGTRERFTATFQKFGQRPDSQGRTLMTMCFENLTDSLGEFISGHIWLDFEEPFWSLDLQPGDVVSFEARVKRYSKGYRGWKEYAQRSIAVDYTLCNPSSVRKIGGSNARSPEE